MKKTINARTINLIFFSLIIILFLVGFLFAAAEAKVVQKKVKGEVTSIEPQTGRIIIEVDSTILPLKVNNDTVFKGATGLEGIKEEDEVKIEYTIDENGSKTITLLEKKT